MRASIIICLIFLYSCSSSHLKGNGDPDANGLNKNFDAIIHFKSNLSKEDSDYWKEIFLGELNKTNSCTQRDKCVCNVEVVLEDDQETFKSWKVFVSGLSFGLIPINFKTTYKATITGQKKVSEYKNEISTWTHLLFAPVFFLTPSKQMQTRVLAKQLRSVLGATCDKN